MHGIMSLYGVALILQAIMYEKNIIERDNKGIER